VQSISLASRRRRTTPAPDEVARARPHAPPEASPKKPSKRGRPPKGDSSRPKGAGALGSLADEGEPTSGGDLEVRFLLFGHYSFRDQLVHLVFSPRLLQRASGSVELIRLFAPLLQIITIASAQEPTTAAPVEVDSALPDALVEAAATKADLNARRPSKGGSSRPKGTRELGSLAGDDVETSGGFLEVCDEGGRLGVEANHLLTQHDTIISLGRAVSLLERIGLPCSFIHLLAPCLQSMLLSSRRGGRQAPEYNKRQKTAA